MERNRRIWWRRALRVIRRIWRESRRPRELAGVWYVLAVVLALVVITVVIGMLAISAGIDPMEVTGKPY